MPTRLTVTLSHVSDANASTAGMLAGDLPALGQDADRIRAVEALAVPSGGGGTGGDICVLSFNGPGVWTSRASTGCAQVATVGGHEPEPARTGGDDVELSGVMGDVVAFTQQQQIEPHRD